MSHNYPLPQNRTPAGESSGFDWWNNFIKRLGGGGGIYPSYEGSQQQMEAWQRSVTEVPTPQGGPPTANRTATASPSAEDPFFPIPLNDPFAANVPGTQASQSAALTAFFQQNPHVWVTTAEPIVLSHYGKPLPGQARLSRTEEANIDTKVVHAQQTSAEALWRSYFTKSEDEVKNLQLHLVHMGRLSPGQFTPKVFDPETQAAFGSVLVNVAQYNNPDMTVQKMLGMGVNIPGTKTATTTETSFTSQGDVAGQYQDVSVGLLGRRATPGEVGGAYSAVHAAEVANPATRTTNTTYDLLTGNQVSQNIVSQGGLGQAGTTEVERQRAMQDPHYGSYQAATTYFNALMNAIGAINSAGT